VRLPASGRMVKIRCTGTYQLREQSCDWYCAVSVFLRLFFALVLLDERLHDVVGRLFVVGEARAEASAPACN